MTDALAWASARVEEVRDSPRRRLELARSLYGRRMDRSPHDHLPYVRAVASFMQWQIRRCVLEPQHHRTPGSPWWRAVNERHLRDTAESIALVEGHPGTPSSAAVAHGVAFAERPSARSWYRAHNASIAAAYLDFRALAEQENLVERFFLNLVLARVLYAHALNAAPRSAVAWAAPVGPLLGDPRVGVTGIFLALGRVLPATYPLRGPLATYTDAEHGFGRLLDTGFIVPRLPALYRWSADDLGVPGLADLVQDGIPSYCWNPADTLPWTQPLRLPARTARRMFPART